MESIQNFKSRKFGEIRTAITDRRLWFEKSLKKMLDFLVIIN